MGHTRMTTQGNEKFNYNNHPFYGHVDENFAFAHNGVLYNDKELRAEKHLPKTKIETDSYVAVQLIEQQGKLNFDALKNMAESVQGSFCFTVLDENNTLYIVKGSNPMCLLHFVGFGLVCLCLYRIDFNEGTLESWFVKVEVRANISQRRGYDSYQQEWGTLRIVVCDAE